MLDAEAYITYNCSKLSKCGFEKWHFSPKSGDWVSTTYAQLILMGMLLRQPISIEMLIEGASSGPFWAAALGSCWRCGVNSVIFTRGSVIFAPRTCDTWFVDLQLPRACLIWGYFMCDIIYRRENVSYAKTRQNRRYCTSEVSAKASGVDEFV